MSEIEEELLAAVEALLFSTGEPLSAAAAAAALEPDGHPASDVRAAFEILEDRRRGTGVELSRVAGGWQLRTPPRFGAAIHRLLGTKPQKLSRSALEVLAIVAWRQPIHRPAIEAVRGVDSGGVLKALLDRGLLRTSGRSPEPGRPLLYCTTDAFLELFGLPDLASLPTMAERRAMVRGGEGPGAVDAADGSDEEPLARADGVRLLLLEPPGGEEREDLPVERDDAAPLPAEPDGDGTLPPEPGEE